MADSISEKIKHPRAEIRLPKLKLDKGRIQENEAVNAVCGILGRPPLPGQINLHRPPQPLPVRMKPRPLLAGGSSVWRNGQASKRPSHAYFLDTPQYLSWMPGNAYRGRLPTQSGSCGSLRFLFQLRSGLGLWDHSNSQKYCPSRGIYAVWTLAKAFISMSKQVSQKDYPLKVSLCRQSENPALAPVTMPLSWEQAMRDS